MNLIDIIVIAIGLAMDCFAVSIACGIFFAGAASRQSATATHSTKIGLYLRIAFLFGLFQGVMPLIGWYAGSSFNQYIEHFDHWIAFGILLALGVKMIVEHFKNDEDVCEASKKDPTRLVVVLTLAVATSIDALAVGLSFAFLDSEPFTPSFIIAVVTFMISLLGLFLGKRYIHKIHIPAELLGGLVLVGIGIKILMEHLFF